MWTDPELVNNLIFFLLSLRSLLIIQDKLLFTFSPHTYAYVTMTITVVIEKKIKTVVRNDPIAGFITMPS